MKKILSLTILMLLVLIVGCSSQETLHFSQELEIDNVSLGTPMYGGDITVAVTNEIDSLDPYMAVAAGTKEIMFNIYEGLVKFTEQGDIIPAVAKSYDISSDIKEYRFYIRDNIKFHNGELVTSDDIIYSLNKAIEKKNSFAFENIDKIEDNEDNSITIFLKEADNDLLPYLTASFVSIIPNNYENSKELPIGTGPFMFSSYKIQQELVMEKFQEYWDVDNVYLDKVTFKLFADENSGYIELLSGSIDLFPSIGIEHYNELKNNFNITLSYKNIVQVLAFNNASEPFDDIRVRQAINHAINKDEIISFQSDGYATKIGTAVLPGFTKYYNESLVDYYDLDVEKAKALLSEAGYPNGFEFSIKVPSNYKFHVNTAEIIAAQLEQIGVVAKIELVEWGTWLEDVYMGREHQATIIGLTGELSPRDWLARYESSSTSNFMNFSSTEYDTKYNEALTIVNDLESVTAYRDAQEIITSNAPAVFIQDTQFLNVMKPNISGYKSYPLYVQDMSCVYYITE